MVIKDLKTLKEFFKRKVKTPIFGVCVYAFSRLGPEEFIPQYQLLALRYSLDTQLIEKDIPVLSLEKGRGIYHLNLPRNSASVLAHPKTAEYLKKFTNPLIIPYKPIEKMMEISKKKHWRIAANPPRFGKEFLEHKLKFRKLLEKINVSVIPGEVCHLRLLEFAKFAKKYGEPFFIQHPMSGGGKGNFLIENKTDFKKALGPLRGLVKRTGEKSVLVAKFVKGPSPSITGCVTRFGILSTSPQDQILSMPQLYNKPGSFGLFCGHDWNASEFEKEIELQAYEIVEKVGEYFKNLGYKGIFGLDFILEEATKILYVTECNPRLLGSFPTITMAQIRNGEPPILGFHILEFLDVEYEIDLKKINQQMRVKRKGAQVLLHNLEGKWVESTAEIEPGVYQLKDGKMEFSRTGYKLSHLGTDDEFLVTEGVPIKKSYFCPNRRLCRILTLGKVLENYRELNDWAKKIIKAVYRDLGVRPIRFPWLKRLLNPRYLVKG